MHVQDLAGNLRRIEAANVRDVKGKIPEPDRGIFGVFVIVGRQAPRIGTTQFRSSQSARHPGRR